MVSMVAFANTLGHQWWTALWPALWQSTALALLVYLVTRVPRLTSPSIRFWLWMLVPLRLLVMPILTVSLPVLPVAHDAPPVESRAHLSYDFASEPLLDPLRALPNPPARGSDTGVESTVAAPPAAVVRESLRFHLYAWLMLCWAGGVGVVALRMGHGMVRLRRLCREGHPLADPGALEAARRAASLAGLDAVPRIILTPEQVSPFACGILSPVVVLPKHFLDNVPRSGILAVLAHEFVHLRRRDSLTGAILAACETIYFFHPVIHLVKRQILFERERACDDWVLTTSRARPLTYAKALLQAAEGSRIDRAYPAPAAVTMESFKDLKGRLASIARSSARHAALTRRALAVLTLMTVLALPGIALTPGRSEPSQMRRATMPVGRARTSGARRTAGGDRVSEAPEAEAQATAAPAAEAPASPTQPATEAVATAATETAEETGVRTRVIHFPKDRSLGTIELVTRGWKGEYRLGYNSDYFSGRTYLADARGDVEVPVDARVWLVFGYGLCENADALADLGPNDLFGLRICGSAKHQVANPDETIMPHLAGLTGLRDLELAGLDITSKGLAHLRGLTNLEYLFLSSKTQDRGALGKLAHMTRLKQLLLYSPVTDQDLVDVAKLRGLRELRVSATNIRGHGLLHLADLPDLRYLCINGTGPGPDITRHVATIKTLRSLRFHGRMPITDASMADLVALKNLEELELIWVTTLTDAAMPHIAKMRKLRKLDLHQTMITDKGLERLRYLPNLEELCLPKANYTRGMELSDEALAHVAEVKSLRRLRATGLFTDAGLEYISSLPELRELAFCTNDTDVSDAGIAHLTRLTHLTDLVLNCDGPTEALTASLARMADLEYVNLHIGRPGYLTVSSISRLNALTNLRHLTTSRVVQDDSVLDLSGLKNLEWLSLNIVDHEGRHAEGAATDDDLACLANLTGLRTVGVNESPGLTDAGLAHLRNLHGLYQFHVGGPRVTDRGLACVAEMSNLHILTLTGAFSDNAIMKLGNLHNLERLTVNTSLPVGNALASRLHGQLPNLSRISGLPGCEDNSAGRAVTAGG